MMVAIVAYAEQLAVVERAGEPLLIGAVLAGGGGVIWWAARTLVELRDSVRGLVVAVYGDPNDKLPNGLKRSVRDLGERMEEHAKVQAAANEWTAKALGGLSSAVEANTQWRLAHGGDKRR